MTVVQHRLDKLFEHVSRSNTQTENPILRKIAVAIKKAHEISEIATGKRSIQRQPYGQISGASIRNVQALQGGMGGYGGMGMNPGMQQGYQQQQQQRRGWDYQQE